MGSTSIKGMPGTAGLDITIVTQGLLPNFPQKLVDEVKEKLGFEYCGPTPHFWNKYKD